MWLEQRSLPGRDAVLSSILKKQRETGREDGKDTEMWDRKKERKKLK